MPLDSGEDAKEKGTRKVGVSFRFIFVFAFSIQRTRLSRSLEQANFMLKQVPPTHCSLPLPLMRHLTGKRLNGSLGDDYV